jgi:hypothetical protein
MTAGLATFKIRIVNIDYLLILLIGKMAAIGAVVNIAIFIEDVIGDRVVFIGRAFFTAKKAKCK